jgi:hypothetical protein
VLVFMSGRDPSEIHSVVRDIRVILNEKGGEG